MEAPAVPDLLPRGSRVSPEVDRTCEDAFEAVDQTPVMRAVARQVELLKYLGSGLEENRPTFLPNSQRGNPDRNQPVLSKGQSVVRVGDDVQLEPAVPTAMLKCSGRRPSDGETAENEGPCVERQGLLISITILSDQLNGLDPFSLPL